MFTTGHNSKCILQCLGFIVDKTLFIDSMCFVTTQNIQNSKFSVSLSHLQAHSHAHTEFFKMPGRWMLENSYKVFEKAPECISIWHPDQLIGKMTHLKCYCNALKA